MDSETTRVLIADQIDPVRAGLKVLLSQADELTVTGEATTVSGAVELVTEQRPDLILLEWGLPGPEGGSIVNMLRTTRPGMAVIALSANPDAHREALDAGADAFVSKLDPPDRLLATMRDCMAKRDTSR
jgi:DNA-binding NarL/FixJ family response regulator